MKNLYLLILVTLWSAPGFCATPAAVGACGSSASPSVSGDPTSGLCSDAAAKVRVEISGANVAEFTSTGVGIGTATPLATLHVNGTIKTAGYTVATLPTGSVGMRAYVTDAATCTINGALTGGGSTFCPVIYNGTAWVGG